MARVVDCIGEPWSSTAPSQEGSEICIDGWLSLWPRIRAGLPNAPIVANVASIQKYASKNDCKLRSGKYLRKR